MDLSIIKDLRKKQGLSQKDLAEIIKVSPSYIHKIECNKKNPSIAILTKISSALNVDPALLLNHAKKNTPSSLDNIPNIPMDDLIQLSQHINSNISIADKLDDVHLLEYMYKSKITQLKKDYESKYIFLKDSYESKITVLEDENDKLKSTLSYLEYQNKKLLNKLNSLILSDKE